MKGQAILNDKLNVYRGIMIMKKSMHVTNIQRVIIIGVAVLLATAGVVFGLPAIFPSQTVAAECSSTPGSSGSVSISYNYDDAGRLTNSNLAGGSVGYTYDSNGNLLNRNHAGFALAPSIDIVAILNGVQISWLHASAANASYEVWRDTVPCFDPDNPGANTVQLGSVAAPAVGQTASFDDTTGVVGTTYFYVVRGVAAGGHVAESVNRVGVFSFDIVAGS